MVTSEQVRRKRNEFRISKHHKEAKPSSLIPASQDKTVLFNTAGMQPLVPYLSGKPHPDGKRLYNIQRCFRTGDLENIGDNTHCTFFEMLGNRSLGDYFKKESLTRTIEFLTQHVGIPLERLGATIFGGSSDGKIPFDKEAKEILLHLGIPEERIQAVPMVPGKDCDNFRGPAGEIGPCGPCCEIYFDRGDEYGPNDYNFTDNKRYVEIRNNVFMDMYKDEKGQLSMLQHKNIDTGMGFERLMTILQNKESFYETDLFEPLIDVIIWQANTSYAPRTKKLAMVSEEEKKQVRSIRIVAEHLRAIVFLLADGVIPSNEGRGYVARRIIRRMWFHYLSLIAKAKKSSGYPQNLSLLPKESTEKNITELIASVVRKYGPFYQHLFDEQETVKHFLLKEIYQFEKTLLNGTKKLDEMMRNANEKVLSGENLFVLYDTFGFPIDLSKELAQEQGFAVDVEGFTKAFEEAQQRSRQGSSKMFAKEIDWASYLENIPPTTFIGYENIECEDMKLLKDIILENGKRVLIFDKTPFYAESGGQIGDKGIIKLDTGEVVRVVDVKKYEGVFLHFVE